MIFLRVLFFFCFIFICGCEYVDFFRSSFVENDVTSIRFWEPISSSQCIPEKALKYIRSDNIASGIDSVPIAPSDCVMVNAKLGSNLNALSHYLKLIPSSVPLFFMVVHDLGSLGSTQLLYDRDDIRGAVVFLDESLFNPNVHPLESREKSAFNKQCDSMRIFLSGEGSDFEVKYIILHELGHVLAAFNSDLFSHADDPEDIFGNKFVTLSWTGYQNGFFQSKFDKNFNERLHLKFYSKNGSFECSSELYKRLAKTSFPTLYSSLNPYEDFAESFALYILEYELGMSYDLKLLSENESFALSSCYARKNCEQKKDFFKTFLHSDNIAR